MKTNRFATMLLVTAGWLWLCPVQAQTNDPAQPPSPREQPKEMTPQERFDRFSQELNLSSKQKQQVQAVFDEMRQKVLEAQTNANSQLQRILTPEQYQKLRSMRQQRMH